MDLRVLIVEDSADDADVIAREIASHGYTLVLERVESEREMRAALSRGRWDVILSDYHLPQFSAPEALRVVQNSRADIPFLIVSGMVGEEAAVAALKAGAHDYLVKDRLARLVPAIERAMRDCCERSERRRAEEALRVSEAQYRSLVEHAVSGIFRATEDGRLITINPALVAMLGYGSRDELRDVEMFQLFASSEAAVEFFNGVREREHVAGFEAKWRRKTGDGIRVRLSGHFTRSIGAQSMFEVMAEDITEPHRLQEQLRQAQKMEAVGQLAGGIAHDFNNVLTAILGYAELLTDQIGPDKPIGRDLREIRVAAERAAALTQQLLAFSRKQVISVTPTDLSKVVRNLEPMLRRLLPESIRIICRLSDRLHPVLADATQLEHLLINLAVNARDAMTDGGTLTISTENAVLDREFVAAHDGASAGTYAAISVSDTGTGMSPDVQRRIFEPFFTTKERGRGTGLGLAAVYGTVKQLGGYIAVDSALGRGTTFTSYFPKTDSNERPAAVSVRAPSAVGIETVLLVEDEDGVRSFAKIALERFGYRVLEADSAESALVRLESLSRPIDLLLTDVVLPGVNGRELARRIGERYPATRVLYMSGYATALRNEAGFQEPGLHVLEKPFTPQALFTKMREVLQDVQPT
ncbi:MAG TPA: response regulator [Vicinamibacterales bacterium]|nr:response regulator [Vicinamibacterales bacterium]